MEKIFTERQKFGSWFIILLIFTSGLPVILIFGFGIYKQLYKGEPFGNNPMSDNALILTFIFSLIVFVLISILFSKACLYTEITKEKIRFKFIPFHLKFREILWESIGNAEVKKYQPIREYGGWGIHFMKGKKSYSVSGSQGLELQLKTGKKILIGTQKQNELKDFLQKMN